MALPLPFPLELWMPPVPVYLVRHRQGEGGQAYSVAASWAPQEAHSMNTKPDMQHTHKLGGHISSLSTCRGWRAHR